VNGFSQYQEIGVLIGARIRGEFKRRFTAQYLWEYRN